jgi:hypothetical protein
MIIDAAFSDLIYSYAGGSCTLRPSGPWSIPNGYTNPYSAGWGWECFQLDDTEDGGCGPYVFAIRWLISFSCGPLAATWTVQAQIYYSPDGFDPCAGTNRGGALYQAQIFVDEPGDECFEMCANDGQIVLSRKTQSHYFTGNFPDSITLSRE